MLLGLRGTIAVNLLDVAAPVEVLRESGEWERVAVPHERAQGPDHLLGIAHLVDCVQNGSEPVLSVEHAMHVVEIVAKAAQAARGLRALPLETTFESRQKLTAEG